MANVPGFKPSQLSIIHEFVALNLPWCFFQLLGGWSWPLPWYGGTIVLLIGYFTSLSLFPYVLKAGRGAVYNT